MRAAAFTPPPEAERTAPGQGKGRGEGRGEGRAFARTAFWEQLYDISTVILHQAGVALWPSTFPEVLCGSHVHCGGIYYDGGEMRQKRKGA